MATEKGTRETGSTAKGIKRDPVTMGEFTAAMKQVLSVKPNTRSENREPTREELNRKFRMVRR